MNYDLIRVKQEAELGREMYGMIDGQIVESVMNDGKIETQKDLYKMIHEGSTFKVTKVMMPRLYNLCEEVKASLNFNEGLNIYISNNPETNAYAIHRKNDESKHIIAIHSALLEKYNDNELKYIIGHEIGHLISRYTKMLDLVNFVFTDKKPPHPAFNNKLQLWRNLSELSADRYGFIASPNLDTVVTCFFKIASGMDSSRISFSPDAYLKETEETLAYFQSQPYSVLGSHPINPVRIKALQLFSQSQLFKELQNDEPLTEDDELHKNIDDLTEILTSLYESELDINIAIFAAIAGMYVATSDGEVSPEELDQIIHSLSSTNIYPRRFLDTILAQENPEDILASTTAKILEESPSIYPHLIAYLTQVAIADKHLRQEELDLIYSMSDALMGVSRRETAQIIGNVIADDFVPRLYAE